MATNQIGETNSDGVVIAFLPRKGDIVEFLSDRQTDKGPASGHVTMVNYKSGICVIEFSDIAETFVMRSLRVKRYVRHRNHDDRKPYWGLI